MRLEIIGSRRQPVWGYPAILNLTLVGAAAGFFVVAVLLSAWNAAFRTALANGHLLMLAPALTMLGILALTLEVGRPLRARFLLANLRHSWMSREGLAVAIFLPSSLAASVSAHPVLRPIAGLSAVGIVVCQGFMLRRARAVPAWNHPLIPALFMTSALATGAGVVLIVAAMGGLPVDAPTALLIAMWLTCDGIVWLAYLWRPGDAVVRAATAPLRRAVAIAAYVGLCRFGPALLLAAFAAESAEAASPRTALIAGCAGVLGGLMLKSNIVRAAGSLRAIAVQFQPAGLEPQAAREVRLR